MFILSGRPFLVYKDHQVLQMASKKKDIHDILTSWMDPMAEYDFEINLRSRKANCAVNYLSRRPFV